VRDLPIDPELSDAELWRRAVEGDSRQFGTLFDRRARAVYNHCFRRIADWSAAEDLTSVVFLEAWRRRGDISQLERAEKEGLAYARQRLAVRGLTTWQVKSQDFSGAAHCTNLAFDESHRLVLLTGSKFFG
jgi:hypothetical protein